jgi:subtilisin family serine protease
LEEVMKADNTGLTSDILEGLNARYANRAAFGGLDVVNMSIGGGGPFNSDCDATSPYNAIFNSLHAAGVAIFVASGNDGFIDGVAHPACHSRAIAVGAVYDANMARVVHSQTRAIALMPPLQRTRSLVTPTRAFHSTFSRPLTAL